MNKKLLAFLFLLVGITALSGCSLNNTVSGKIETGNNFEKTPEMIAADKVEVFLFHTTQRCVTCIAIGKLSGETVYEFFQPELRDDKIEFREINLDLPENKELANKFQASGSSLFINAIYKNEDHITEDTRVWRLTQDEAQFKVYLKEKLKSLLGK